MKSARKKSVVDVRRDRSSAASLGSDHTAALQALQSFRTIFGSARTHDADVRRLCRISGSQLWALSEIVAHPGTTVNELAEQMALHQTTASNLVNALVVRKLIRRVRDGEDGRVFHLHPSVEGKKTLVRLPGPHAGLLFDALRRLQAEELAQVRACLAVLVSLMQRTAQDAAREPLMGE